MRDCSGLPTSQVRRTRASGIGSATIRLVTEAPSDIPVVIRDYRPEDRAACRQLYLDGLVQGARLADNDTGLDMDDIASAYAARDGNGFWVAQNDAGEVVGMIGVQQFDEGRGEIRRLRVRQDHQRRGIGAKLLERALHFCQENGYLKVTLGTSTGTVPAVKLFEKFHFHLDRSKTVQGKDMLYFYLDLYARDRRGGQE
jgi:ribosomal protein S18 acetylase RimI-like enzyme